MINRKLINQGLCILLGGMMAIGGACLPVLAGECDAGSTVIAAGEAQTEAAEENAAGEPEGIDAGEDIEEVFEKTGVMLMLKEDFDRVREVEN